MLRLGTETGSLVNHVWSRTRPVGPEDVCEGMGATFLSWTDRHAATVHAVWTEGKKTRAPTSLCARTTGSAPTATA